MKRHGLEVAGRGRPSRDRRPDQPPDRQNSSGDSRFRQGRTRAGSASDREACPRHPAKAVRNATSPMLARLTIADAHSLTPGRSSTLVRRRWRMGPPTSYGGVRGELPA